MTDECKTQGDVRLREEEVERHVCCVKPRLCRDEHFHERDVERIVAARVGEVVEERDHWRRRWQAQREQFREMLFEGMSLADWHAKHCAAVQARREVVERVEAACRKSEILTQGSMGHVSEHWRGRDYADGLDAGIEVTAGLVRDALRAADAPLSDDGTQESPEAVRTALEGAERATER